MQFQLKKKWEFNPDTKHQTNKKFKLSKMLSQTKSLKLEIQNLKSNNEIKLL